MTAPEEHIYEFGPFRLVPAEHSLLRDGEPVPLRPKVFDLLLFLVERHGRLATKEELMRAVWPDQIVEEGNLNKNVSMARQALGEAGQAFIETVPKRGYRFVAPVRRISTAEASVEGAADAPAGAPHRVVRWPFVVAGIVAVLVGIAWSITRARRGDAIRSVAVMPFANESRDPRADYVSEGITEALINDLSQLGSLKVMSRNSVYRFKGRSVDAREVGKALGVASVLMGNVKEAADRLEVDVELIDARDGSVLWSRTYTRPVSDVLALQTTVARDVAGNLRVELSGAERQQLARRHTHQVEAYHLYMKGRYFWNRNRRTPEDFRKSRQFYEQAIARDPQYALAYAALAEVWNLETVYSEKPSRESIPQARAAAVKALELDEKLAEAHTALGWIKLTHDWDWKGAEREFLRAIELNPNHAPAHNHYGGYLAAVGRFDEAIARKKTAIELDPLSAPLHAAIAWIYHFAGRQDEAIAASREALSLEEGFYRAHLYAGLALEQKREYAQALTRLERALALSGENAEVLAAIAHVQAAAGRRDMTQQILDRLVAASAHKHVDPYSLAVVYAALGEKDRAFDSLRNAIEERSIMMIWLGIDPRLADLRSDQRYEKLLRRNEALRAR